MTGLRRLWRLPSEIAAIRTASAFIAYTRQRSAIRARNEAGSSSNVGWTSGSANIRMSCKGLRQALKMDGCSENPGGSSDEREARGGTPEMMRVAELKLNC